MTENNPNLVSLLEALAEVLKMIEATRDSSRENEPEPDPTDPLNEVVGNPRGLFAPASAIKRLRVDSYLAEKGKPETLRNVLMAYASLHPAENWFVYRGSGDGKLYGIYRVLDCRTEACG